MDKDDWIGAAFAVAIALCAALAVRAAMQPQPEQQWIVRIEYTPAKE